MKNTILKFCVAMLTVLSLASCTEKPSYLPNYDFEDLWAAVDAKGQTNTLYEFKNGFVTVYESEKNKKYTVSDNVVTGCSESDFEDANVYPYYVKVSTVFFGKDMEKVLGDLKEKLSIGKYGVFCMTTLDGFTLVRVEDFSKYGADDDDDDEEEEEEEEDDDDMYSDYTWYKYLPQSSWGVVGTFNNWGNDGDPDIVMYDFSIRYDVPSDIPSDMFNLMSECGYHSEEYYAAFYVYLTTSDEFKFREWNNWDSHLAISYEEPVEYQTGYYLADGYSFDNMRVAETGYYHILIDKNLDIVWFLPVE